MQFPQLLHLLFQTPLMPLSIQLDIPNPCHENWNAMTPQEQGRFCGSCQKTVVDFSKMTDKEIVNYFSTASHQVCGRFSTTQLNKDLPLKEKKKRFSFTYLWNLLLAGFLVTESSCEESMTGKVSVEQPPARVMSMGDTIIAEQPPTTKGEVAVIDSPDPVPPTDITGIVTDENSGKPVPDVTVMIKGANTGTITDSLGNFHLSVEKKDRVILIFSSLGYKTETRILNDQTNWNAVKVSLRESNEVLTGVVIAHTPSKQKRSKTQK